MNSSEYTLYLQYCRLESSLLENSDFTAIRINGKLFLTVESRKFLSNAFNHKFEYVS